MAAIVPTYIPAPNWNISADSPIVVLGRLIKDAKNPESQISKADTIPVPASGPSGIQYSKKKDWKTTSAEIRSGKNGIWAKFLQIVGLGGDLSFTRLKESLEEHKFEHLETKYFVADDEYIAEAMQDAYVEAYFEASGKKAVYMITGVMIARSASVETKKKKYLAADANVGVDLTTTLGVPVTFGPEGSWNTSNDRSISYAASTDYFFAYRLKKIVPKKKGGYGENDHVNGAVFGLDDDDADAKRSLRELFDIDDECGASGLGFPCTSEELIVDKKEETVAN